VPSRLRTLKASTSVIAAVVLVTVGSSAVALVATEASSNTPVASAPDSGNYPYIVATAADCPARDGSGSWCIAGSELSKYRYAYRNCTDYVAWKMDSQFHIRLPQTLGNAATWGSRLEAAGYSYDSTPHVGDIAAWNHGDGGLGHVAYVYAVTNGIASLDEYNVAGTGLFSSNRTTASASAGTPSEYIRIGNPATPTTLVPAPTRATATPTTSASSTFTAKYTWSWKYDNGRGYSDSGTLSTGPIEHLQDLSLLPGFSSQSAIVASCSSFDANTDGLIPVRVQLTNSTPNFPSSVSDAIYLDYTDDFFYHDLQVSTPGTSGSANGCVNIASWENQSTNGGNEGGPWTVNSSGDLAAGASTPYIYAYFILSGYYTPDNQSGDPSVLANAVLALNPEHLDPYVSFTGPGYPQGDGLREGLMPLNGQTTTCNGQNC
jgi:surface antigen